MAKMQLEKIRDYFLDNDKTPFEHRAYTFLSQLSAKDKEKDFKTEKEFWDWFNQQPPGSVDGSVIWSAAKEIYENEKDELLHELADGIVDAINFNTAKADKVLQRYNAFVSSHKKP